MAKQTVTESEYELMKIMWEAEKPLSLGEILTRLDGKWVRNTVGTLLTRLCEKGVAGYEKKGKSYLYYAVLDKKDFSMSETKSFLSKLYNGSVGRLVASLYENGQLSGEEIDELKRIIDGKTK